MEAKENAEALQAAVQIQNRSEIQEPAYINGAVLPCNLILEGGAMRGQFTAGVLDFFMDQGLWFKRVIGVSAGALCGFHYVAGDIGRSCYLNLKYCDDWRYLSMQSFVRTGNAYGRQFVFDEIPNELEPFNYAALLDSPMELTTVSTDMDIGEADYHAFRDLEEGMPYLIASSSMPLVSQPVETDGKRLLDGGIADSVPIVYSLLTGVEKHVVILTQHDGFVKAQNKLLTLARQRYSDFPYFVERMHYRHIEYNRTYRLLKRMHQDGDAFIIRPPERVTVSSMEKDHDKLLALYMQGYEEAARTWKDLGRYLES